MMYALVNKNTGKVNHSPTATSPQYAWYNAQLWEETKGKMKMPKVWRDSMKKSGWVAKPVHLEVN